MKFKELTIGWKRVVLILSLMSLILLIILITYFNNTLGSLLHVMLGG